MALPLFSNSPDISPKPENETGNPVDPVSSPSPSGGRPPSNKATDEQREKWRRRYWLKKRAAGLAPEGGALDSPPPPPVPGQESGGPDVSPPASVWNPEPIRQFIRAILPSVEKYDIASLSAKAARLGDPEVLAMVEKGAQWPSPAKATIESTLPEVIADGMTQAGIDPKYFPLVACAGAIGSIATGRALLNAKLDRLIAENQSKRSPEPPQP